MDDYLILYNTNSEFHDFVERLRRPGKHLEGMDLSIILSMQTIKDVGDYYRTKSINETEIPNIPTMYHDVCDCDDKSC